MVNRKFYTLGKDSIKRMHPEGFMRYGSLHTLDLSTVQVVRSTFGEGWEVTCKVIGSHTYDGLLSTRALQAQTTDGKNLTFRTKADAIYAMRETFG